VFFVQNYFTGIWAQTWSLAVEEHFYLLLPLMFWLMSRLNRSSNPFRGLPGLFMVVSSMEIILRLIFTWNMADPVNELSYLSPTHLRMDGLLFGVLLGYYYHFDRKAYRQIAESNIALSMTGVAFMLILIVPLNSPIMHTVGYTCVLLGFGFLLLRAVDWHPHRYTAACLKPLASIGYYSYSIYLWHGWTCRLLPRRNFTEFACSLVASLALGIIMANLIEFPALRFRDRLIPSRPVPALAPQNELL
jgi:peptidoglycan/LPS O-acetylase OafA/YrhL